jgi:hypothetical protein
MNLAYYVAAQQLWPSFFWCPTYLSDYLSFKIFFISGHRSKKICMCKYLYRIKPTVTCQPPRTNNHYWSHLLGCPQGSFLSHFCSQVGMASKQLDRICSSVKDFFPQAQCVTLSGESSQPGQGPGWHLRLQIWFPQDNFFSHTPSQGKYLEAEDSWVHGTSCTTFPQ